MNDKRFWQGALIGAAATFLLTNDKVRGKLVDLVTGAGNMVKNSGSAVKEKASHTVDSVRENVTTGGEIFRDTYAAGKQGFQASVKKHQSPKEQPDVEPVIEIVEVEASANEKPAQPE
ncbi:MULTISPECIES: hypothetical protein [unclassified Endozoicomonas]|uniref:hypothetical protein n=1 Tax=unclassified Endozoicomonas TaxID=2644528 RepID=UPI003BB4CA2A